MNNAGDFDKYIRIEQPNDDAAENSAGELDLTEDTSWKLFHRCWAQVETQGGREVERLKQNTPDLSHIVRVRYSSKTKSLDPTMRLVLGDRKLELISAYDKNEQHEVVEMMCREVRKP